MSVDIKLDSLMYSSLLALKDGVVNLYIGSYIPNIGYYATGENVDHVVFSLLNGKSNLLYKCIFMNYS